MCIYTRARVGVVGMSPPPEKNDKRVQSGAFWAFQIMLSSSVEINKFKDNKSTSTTKLNRHIFLQSQN